MGKGGPPMGKGGAMPAQPDHDSWNSAPVESQMSGMNPPPPPVPPPVSLGQQQLQQLQQAYPPQQQQMQQQPPPQQQGLPPAVPISLAPATLSITPVSSKKPQEDQTKALAVQFLNADQEKQTQMLRDPNVARAILATLGESGASPLVAAAAAGTAPGAAGEAAPPPAPAPAAPAAPPGVPGPPPAPAPPPAPPSVAWTGRMSITRSGGKQLNTQASLLYGKVQLVELALRIAAGAF